MASLKIKKGDTVRVIAGKDKDKEGKVLAVNAEKGTVVVEGVNMTPEHAAAIADVFASLKHCRDVELLPYHQAAGAKYQSAGMQYQPRFPVDQPPQIHTKPFKELGMEVHVL